MRWDRKREVSLFSFVWTCLWKWPVSSVLAAGVINAWMILCTHQEEVLKDGQKWQNGDKKYRQKWLGPSRGGFFSKRIASGDKVVLVCVWGGWFDMCGSCWGQGGAGREQVRPGQNKVENVRGLCVNLILMWGTTVTALSPRGVTLLLWNSHQLMCLCVCTSDFRMTPWYPLYHSQ